jgi:hypothetical protein
VPRAIFDHARNLDGTGAGRIGGLGFPSSPKPASPSGLAGVNNVLWWRWELVFLVLYLPLFVALAILVSR